MLSMIIYYISYLFPVYSARCDQTPEPPRTHSAGASDQTAA